MNPDWLARIAQGDLLRLVDARGARRDFAVRDDERWLKHTLAWHADGGTPRLDYKSVTIDTWKPVERKY